MTKTLALSLTMLIIATTTQAARLHSEKYYQDQWCTAHGGKTEVVLDDHTRVDCLTATHAIEFDFANKWPEAIGQSLYYSTKTGKIPGIVLILEHQKDHRFWQRLIAATRNNTPAITHWPINNK